MKEMNNMGYTTKSKLIYDVLKQRIESGFYHQGESIVISRVADEMGASAIPIREAMKRLETEGYLKIIPHKGAEVTMFNVKQITEIVEMRAVLEGLAAVKAIKCIGEGDIKELNRLIELMDESIEAKNVAEFRKLNKEFHTIIYKASSGERLCEMINQLWEMSSWAYKKMVEGPDIMRRSNKEHREIVRMLVEKSEDKIEQFVRAHKLKLKSI